MTDPIDKVARAIATALKDAAEPGVYLSSHDDITSFTIDGAFDLRVLAIAALRAIREPTDEMKRAAEAAIDDYHAGDSLKYDEIGRIFTAAIDKALET